MAAGLFGNNAVRPQSTTQIDPETLRRLLMQQEQQPIGPGATSVTPVVPPLALRDKDTVVGPLASDPSLNSTISTGPTRLRPGMFGAASRSPSAMAAKGVLDDAMQQNASDPSMRPIEATQPGNGMGAANPTVRAPTGFDAVDNVPALNTSVSPTFADPSQGGIDMRMHPKFFEYGGAGRKIAGVLGEALQYVSAATGNPLAMMHFTGQQADRNAQRQLAVWNQQHQVQRGDTLDDRQYEDNKPRYFSGGQDQIKFDPTTGTSTPIYDAPRPEEAYALGFGAKGTPEYQTALQEYVLKGWSPTAMDARTDLADHRFNNSVQLRQTPSYANLHPRAPAPRAARLPNTGNVVAGILQKGASGAALSPQEQQIFNSYVNGRRGGGSAGTSGPKPGASAAVTEGTIIKNPATGQRMKMQGGQWVPVK